MLNICRLAGTNRRGCQHCVHMYHKSMYMYTSFVNILPEQEGSVKKVGLNNNKGVISE